MILNQDDSIVLTLLVEPVHGMISKWLHERSPCKLKKRIGIIIINPLSIYNNSIGWDDGVGILPIMWESLNDVDRSKIRQKKKKNPKIVFPYFWNFIEALTCPMALIPLNIFLCSSQGLSKDI